MKNLSQALNVYDFCTNVLGISEKPSKVQVLRLIFFPLTIVTCIILCYVKTFNSETTNIEKVWFSALGAVCFSMGAFVILFIKKNGELKECLIWCQNLHKIGTEVEEIQELFENAEKIATKLFEKTLPTCVTIGSGTILQSVVFSCINGRLEPMVPIYITDDFLSRFLTLLVIEFAAFTLLLGFFTVFNVILTTISYTICILEIMKIWLKKSLDFENVVEIHWTAIVRY